MYTASILVDTVVSALADFIQPFVSANVQIVQAQVNRVPPPVGPYVLLTPILQTALSTAREDYDPVTDSVAITTPKRYDIQIDFYGESSGDWCAAVVTVFRSLHSPNKFPDGIAPLYCGDGIQSPMLSGEQQWESRWTTTASLQVNAEIVVPQQFFDKAVVNLINCEVTYPTE